MATITSVPIDQMREVKLIFVYNANASVFSQLTDYAHKILSPQTYACNLCRLTYDNHGMKKEWKEFIQSLPVTSQFMHKDEFARKYPNLVNTPLPAVFQKKDNQLTQLVTSEEINRQQTVTEFEKSVKAKLS